MAVFILSLPLLALLLTTFYRHFLMRTVPAFGRRKPVNKGLPENYRYTKKPEWVINEILRMKALMPSDGCRALADSFNRRFAHKQMSVGKSFVSDTIRKHKHEIQVLRRKLKHRKPKPMPINRVWAMDLTGKSDTAGKVHNILGIIDHGSRANLSLLGLKDKASVTLLRHLLDAIEQYGKPKFLRTDNESVFTSRLFRLGLWLLGIRHQRTDKGCPCDRHGWRKVEQCRSNCRDEWQSREVFWYFEGKAQ